MITNSPFDKESIQSFAHTYLHFFQTFFGNSIIFQLIKSRKLKLQKERENEKRKRMKCELTMTSKLLPDFATLAKGSPCPLRVEYSCVDPDRISKLVVMNRLRVRLAVRSRDTILDWHDAHIFQTCHHQRLLQIRRGPQQLDTLRDLHPIRLRPLCIRQILQKYLFLGFNNDKSIYYKKLLYYIIISI